MLGIINIIRNFATSLNQNNMKSIIIMICVNTNGFEYLTAGKYYNIISTVQYDDETYITIINDGGASFSYPAHCFKLPN